MNKYNLIKKIEYNLLEVRKSIYDAKKLFDKKSITYIALRKFSYYLHLFSGLGWRNRIWVNLPCLDRYDLFRMANGLYPILDKKLKIEGGLFKRSNGRYVFINLYVCKLCGQEYSMSEIKDHLINFHKVSSDLGQFYIKSKNKIEVIP